MFDVHCEGCGTAVIVTTRRILTIDNTSAGIVVRWVCRAGHVGATTTGRHRTAY